MSSIVGQGKFRLGRGRSGLGLFANVMFAAGERVIEYTGERISAEEADRRRGRYLFHIDAGHVLDARGREHLARYINHACRPNCEAREEDGRIFITAKRAIAPGEELNYHYGRVYFRAFIAPVGCRCATCARRAGAVSRRTASAPPPPPPPAPHAAGSGRRGAPARAGTAR